MKRDRIECESRNTYKFLFEGAQRTTSKKCLSPAAVYLVYTLHIERLCAFCALSYTAVAMFPLNAQRSDIDCVLKRNTGK